MSLRKSNKLYNLRFSPEFEFLTPMSMEQVDNLLINKQFAWNVKSDYSINNGWEICPSGDNHLRGNEGQAECNQVLLALNHEAEATQSPKTGFHLHWNLVDDNGVGYFTPKQLTNIMIDWYNFKRVIELIMPQSRRGDHQVNLSGISRRLLEEMIGYATELGKDSKEAAVDFISRFGTGACKDIRINGNHRTLEFRKMIFTVDSIKCQQWIEFTRNFIGFNAKKRQKGFRTILPNPDERLSLTHPKGLSYSFREVFQYRAGNFGAFELAEKRAINLARHSQEVKAELEGIVANCEAKNNRSGQLTCIGD